MTLWSDTQGTGFPLVLVHGWGMNASVWDSLLPLLTDDFEVTRVELPGHGFSEYDNDKTSLQDWAESVLETAPDRAIWLGWSLGALVAMQAALLKSEKIAGLFVIAGTPCFAQRENWPCAMDNRVLEQFASNLQQDTDATLMRFLSLQIKGAGNARDLLKELRHGFSLRPSAKDEALNSGLKLLVESDMRKALSSLSMPHAWLLGQRDTLIPACVENDLNDLSKDMDVAVIKGAAHVPFLSHADDCVQALKKLREQCCD